MNARSLSPAFNSIDELIGVWDLTENAEALSAEPFVDLGRSALAFEHPSLAFDILNRRLGLHPEHAQLNYCAALALARAGSNRSASELLEPLLSLLTQRDPLHGEAMSLAGRLAKDCYQKLSEPVMRRGAARKSANRYRAAFDASEDYFLAINAATMTMLAGDAAAKTLAEAVLESACSARLGPRRLLA